MNAIDEIIRPEVLKIEAYPYSLDKPLAKVMQELGLRKMINLGSNENSLGPSPRAGSAMRQEIRTINRYPDGSCAALRESLAKKHGVSLQNIIAGAGSDELIELLAKTYLNPGDEIIVSQHAFVRYKAAGDLMGAKVVITPMRDLTHDLESMLGNVTAKTKIIFVANPNNPTGTYNKRDEVEKFLVRLPEKVLVVFDEAYFEFSQLYPDYPDTAPLFSKHKNVVTLRTFSKIYGLAGLRIGYVVASENVVSSLNRVRQPFNVSRLAQAAALASLSDSTHIQRSVKMVEVGKKFLYQKLDKIGASYTASAANFVLINTQPLPGSRVAKECLRSGIIVRSLDDYDLPRHIRVTVGTPGENRAFIRVLSKIINNHEGDREK